MEEIPNITSDIIDKLKKLNINSVYQLAVQNPIELASEYEDTSINVEAASVLVANARKILVENGVLTNEFSTADEVLEKRNKLTRFTTGSSKFDDLLSGDSRPKQLLSWWENLDLASRRFVIHCVLLHSGSSKITRIMMIKIAIHILLRVT